MEEKNQYKKDESYRDSISTVDKDGKRIWIYPKKPKGKLYDYRKYVSYFLLSLLFVTPFLKINGNPVLMLNIIERKFVILGNIFWPQDFHLFVFAMITFVVFIILFTVVFGRLFCGWACPQTIFMEMFFRRIEYFIEGDWQQQKALNKKKWTKDYILKNLVSILFLRNILSYFKHIFSIYYWK
jgi:polyferredoxin